MITFLGDSSIFLRNDGRLVLGQNKTSPGLAVEKPFAFSFQPIRLAGDGIVEFVPRASAPSLAFEGKLAIPTAMWFEDDSMTFDQLAQFFVQTKDLTAVGSQGDTRQCGFVFIGSDGRNHVRTGAGKNVTLLAGDVIIGAVVRKVGNKDKCFILGRTATGSAFEIDEDGNRS